MLMGVPRYLSLLLPFGALLVLCAGQLYDDPADKDLVAELPRIPPKSPAESLKAMRVHAGFRVELVAAEPQVASPVAIDFDEDGRVYVVELVDFNQASSQTQQGRGRVRLLQDTDGD